MEDDSADASTPAPDSTRPTGFLLGTAPAVDVSEGDVVTLFLAPYDLPVVDGTAALPLVDVVGVGQGVFKQGSDGLTFLGLPGGQSRGVSESVLAEIASRISTRPVPPISLEMLGVRD